MAKLACVHRGCTQVSPNLLEITKSCSQLAFLKRLLASSFTLLGIHFSTQIIWKPPPSLSVVCLDYHILALLSVGLPRCKNLTRFSLFVSFCFAVWYCLKCFCFLCFTSSVSFTGSYTEVKPLVLILGPIFAVAHFSVPWSSLASSLLMMIAVQGCQQNPSSKLPSPQFTLLTNFFIIQSTTSQPKPGITHPCGKLDNMRICFTLFHPHETLCRNPLILWTSLPLLPEFCSNIFLPKTALQLQGFSARQCYSSWIIWLAVSGLLAMSETFHCVSRNGICGYFYFINFFSFLVTSSFYKSCPSNWNTTS